MGVLSRKSGLIRYKRRGKHGYTFIVKNPETAITLRHYAPCLKLSYVDEWSMRNTEEYKRKRKENLDKALAHYLEGGFIPGPVFVLLAKRHKAMLQRRAHHLLIFCCSMEVSMNVLRYKCENIHLRNQHFDGVWKSQEHLILQTLHTTQSHYAPGSRR